MHSARFLSQLRNKRRDEAHFVQAHLTSHRRFGAVEGRHAAWNSSGEGDRSKGQRLVVSTPLTSLVVDPSAVSAALEQYKALVASQTAKYLDNIRNEAAEAGVACSALCIEHDKPYEAIVDTAKNNGCDLVVMASHGLRGVSAILGSETLKVLTHSAVPILVYR